MADIFISYSSRDREKAEQLTELLSSAGLSVWIDQAGIDISSSWSKEIVQAINECKAFLVLLSSSSVASHNVAKEVSLASEKQKRILPLELEPVTLTEDLEYHLAGIHRAPLTDTQALLRAIKKIGFDDVQIPTYQTILTDTRKSLMILPFEDYSPTADNEWFANGVVSELISSLSNISALRVMDAQTTKEFKNFKGHLTTYAREMQIRYFVQGDVRKFSDQIKITARLLDIETGAHLWQDSLKGTMDDIFTMQEEVAKNVAEGLQVIITKEEEKKIEKKPTENTEAYELWLKAKTYYDRTTKVDFERSLSLNETAVSLDPKFISAHVNIANTALEYHRIYSRDRTLLEKAERHIAEVIALEGESARVNYLRSRLFAERGDLETSLRYAVVATELDPEFGAGFDSLGSTYQALGNMVEAARAWKLHADLRDSDPQAHFNYLIMLHEIGDDERLNEEVARARPVFERHIRLTPDDVTARVNYLHVLLFAGYTTEAIVGAQEIEQIESIDGIALYNLCCFYLRVGEGHRAFPLLRSAIERGYSNIQTLRRDPDIDPLRGTPEFETLMKELEEKIAQEKHG